MKKFWFSLFPLLFGTAALAGNVVSLSYSGTNVTTSAYVQLTNSSPITVSKIEVCDSSTKIIKVAIGASGSELDVFSAPISGCAVIPIYLVAGTRVSLKAVDASATSGYMVMSFVQ